MAAATPRTHVVGETIDAAILNADRRDNLNALFAHQHSGALGDGDDETSGMDSITFDYIADPAAPGANELVLYTKSGGVFFRDGAAGPVTQLSDVNHSH